VRDGIAFARLGIPAVALVTETFWPQGHFVAGAAGMPDLPRQQLPHPVAGSGRAAMADVASDIADSVISKLRGAPA
jgi:hypothetical protein